VNASELKRAKRDVRRRVIAARDALSTSERAAAAEAVATRLLALPELQQARAVMAFASFGSELSTDPLIDGLYARGIRVGLPRIDGVELDVRSFRPGDPTTIAPFGAREPADGDRIAPDSIDAVITPAVAFDRRGRRIGYGGGFYDRFLLRTRSDAVRIGVGADVQILEEDLPAGSFDLRVHVIVTPTETIRCEP
jgi:5-formyltetrahydrofolate cyclo-ligase